MDIESIIAQYFDPEIVKWVLGQAGIDMDKLVPPNLKDANFKDVNQMGVHYFIIFYPIFMALCIIYVVSQFVISWQQFFMYKIQEQLYCSINIKMDDDSFGWVNRYM